MHKRFYQTAFFLVVLVCLTALSTGFARAGSESIVAVVNEDAVSASDLNDRVKLIMVSSGMPDTPDMRARVGAQVLNSLIDEQIRMQYARELELSVTPEEVAEGFATIAKQNNYEPEQFRGLLKQAGINIGTMERQIESQIIWGKVVQSKIRPQIVISDSDIETYVSRIKANKGKNEYLLAEIFLPVENPQDEGDTRQLANKLQAELKAGAPFPRVAQQFSKSAGAARGGDLGWVMQDQLAPEILDVIGGMEKNSLSQPVRSVSGYHIVLLRDKRTITDESIPALEEVRSIIGTERLERQQRRLFMDLKADAFIDNRVKS